VKCLIEAKANVNLAALDGVTPLHQVFSGGGEVARLLLENGANVNARDGSGFLPLHYCVGSPVEPESTEVVKVLLDCQCEVESRILLASIKDNASTLKTDLLVKSGLFTDDMLKEGVKKAIERELPELASIIASGLKDHAVKLAHLSSIEAIPTFGLMCSSLEELHFTVEEVDFDIDPKKWESMLMQLVCLQHPKLRKIEVIYSRKHPVPLQFDPATITSMCSALYDTYTLNHVSFIYDSRSH